MHSKFCFLTVCVLLGPALSLSGQPESYAEYFSLNGTTAELLILKPIDRELYRRFDLVIKVRNTGTAKKGRRNLIFEPACFFWKRHPPPQCAVLFFPLIALNPQISIKLLISKSVILNKKHLLLLNLFIRGFLVSFN